MARTKTKTRSASSPAKTTAPNADPAVAEFAEAEDFPEAETIADLKKASATAGSGAAGKKKKSNQKKKDDWSVAERLRFKWGTGGVKTLSFLIRIVLFVMLVIVVWTAVLSIASALVPTVGQLVSDGTGVTFESRLDHIIMGLLMPTLFLNGLLFVLVCVLVKKLWIFHVRLGTKARNVLLGTSD